MNLQKQLPWRSKKYTDWVSSLPSCVSGLPADDPHHIKCPGMGGSVKCSDFFTIPLTRAEHREFHDRGWKAWEADHGSQWEHVARTQAKALEAIARGELEL